MQHCSSEALHCKEPIPKFEKQIFPEKELRGHSTNFHIHVSVSDLYIPTIDLLILLQEICGPILGIYNGCPYAGDIFTFKNSFTAHMCFFTLEIR